MGDNMNKVVIVGCGNVGMSYAYALINQKTSVNELALIDLNEERVTGEVMDLNHGLAFAPKQMNIHVGSYKDCSDANIVVIAAGANQEKGETRMDLIDKNSKIFKGIVDNIMKNGFQGIFLIATNPVDIMTYLTYHYAQVPASHVIGTGTSLDTARLRYMLGHMLDISPRCVNGYVLGEHGDSEFIPWSNANVGLQSIYDFLQKEQLDKIEERVRNAAYDIINRKGATYYGIGTCLVRITNAILDNENAILTVSSYDDNNDVFVGGPTIINKDGVKNRIYVKLTEEESNKLQHSIDVIKDARNHVLK